MPDCFASVCADCRFPVTDLLTTACAPSQQSQAPAPGNAAACGWLSCRQLDAAAIRPSNYVAQLTGLRQRKASKDAVTMGVSMALFWPVRSAPAATSPPTGPGQWPGGRNPGGRPAKKVC